MRPRSDGKLESTSGRVRAFDGLRAVAIGMVVLFHAGMLPGGWLGVDVFFGLSGYLITRVICVLWSDGRSSPARRFYQRRAARLVPASALLLITYTAITLIAEPDLRHERLISVSAAATYTYNILAAQRYMVGLGHMWSLSMEEQSYIAWPLVLAGCLRRHRPVAALTACVLGMVAALTWNATLIQAGAQTARVAFGPDTRVAGLLAGSAVALLAQHARFKTPTGSSCWILPPGFLVSYLALHLSSLDVSSYYVWPVITAGLAACCLVVLEADQSGIPARVLALSPFVFVGDISYGLYLWHLPVLEAFFRGHPAPSWSLIVTAISLSVSIATASRFLLEKPILRWASRVCS